MFNSLINELSTGWVWAFIPFACFWTWKFIRKKIMKKYSKFTLFKVIRLRFKELDHPPFYNRTHHSIPDHSEDVYDESWVINGTQCNYDTDLKIKITSSGTADVQQILPELSLSKDTHPHTGNAPGYWNFTGENTNRIAAIGVLINGLQNEIDWGFATAAQYNNQDLFLMADFSSLPNAVNIISRTHAKLITKEAGEIKHIPMGIEETGPDIYSVSKKNCKEGDVLTIDFKIDPSCVKSF
jgi:hypothetical protein